jgi:hypothetical protein
MKPNITASQLGLPLLKGPVRFAVGPPDGLTSNSWRMWTSKVGDIYIACRDNFKEAKVSLHASGRWRMGFTTEAISKKLQLLPPDTNRAWDVWDEPPASLPDSVIAFRLIFPTSELAVRPEQRSANLWKPVLYIEQAPPGKVTIITLFVTKGALTLRHESEPSFCLASLAIGNNRRAQLLAHTDPSDGLDDFVEKGVANASKQAESAGVVIPKEGYFYLFGQRDNGCRFIIGARANRSS